MKKLYFIQVVMSRASEASRETVAAEAVKALEGAGYEPSTVLVEAVTKRERYDEIQAQMNGSN